MKKATAKELKIKSVPSPIHKVGDTVPEVADSIKELQPYEPVSSLPKIMAKPEIDHFKLDWNEATIPPSPKVKKALLKYLDSEMNLNYYPQLFSTDLRARLQTHVGYSADHILATNGSDDALELISKTFINPGDHVLSPYPTYTHALLFARSRGAVLDKLMMEDPFSMDSSAVIDAVAERVTEETKMIYLVNPNNPTGYLFDNDDLARLAKMAPHAVILIDEAYAEFARDTAMDLVSDHKNVIVTRTFSKLFGLAALRVGFMVANPALIKDLTRLYNPKSVNQMAQVAAIAALDDMGYYEKYIDEVEDSKKLLGRWCDKNGIFYHNTPANFVMIRVDNVKDVVAELANEAVYVRDRSSFPGLEDCFRLNLGTVEQTTQVILRFEKVLKKLNIIN